MNINNLKKLLVAHDLSFIINCIGWTGTK